MSTIPYEAGIHYNYTYEKGVLGVFLLEKDSFEAVSGVMDEELFFYSDTRTVYNAIKSLWIDGSPIDTFTVLDALRQSGIKDLKGNTINYYVPALYQDIVSSANLTYWAYRLREMYAKREMFKLSMIGKNTELDPFEQAKEVEDILKKVFDIRSVDDWRDMSYIGIELTKHIENIQANGEDLITTGIKELDSMNGGFRRGELVVLAARPSVGKSALMGKIAMCNAKAGRNVGIIPLEMKSEHVHARMTSLDSGVEHWKITRAKFDDEKQRNYVYQTISDMATLPIYMTDNTDTNIFDIRVKTKMLKKKRGELSIILIDYLQLIGTVDGKNKNREQQIAELSRGLKVLAMQENIVVILLAQLNRKSEERQNKKPAMADLRESGAIEQDADVVMLLHRDEQSGILSDENGMSTDGQADLICAKWRNGATTSIKLGFDKQKMKFYEYDAPSSTEYFQPANNDWQP